ncbi:MAG TPA: substrate-binding domain-containing protein [Gemmatimonadales bacterium]|nr:substrate-binding domain-containing protein [Gemmatimonadales bacterium]
MLPLLLLGSAPTANGAGDGRAALPALRVCADPNNLPFSNQRGEGFENRIAELVARDLGARVEYTWWAQRRGFLRETLNARRCDVVMGIAPGAGPVLTTAPYYRSTYVFVSRRDRNYAIRSFDDPRLGQLTIGVHVIGDDYNSLPPGVALARRGLTQHLVGYSIYGDYRDDSPPSALVKAVERSEVDIACAWGPLAGYYARRSPVALRLEPVAAQGDVAAPFTYAIAAGVRRGDEALRDRLERVLVHRRREIRQILAGYGVPLLPLDGTACGAGPAEGACD